MSGIMLSLLGANTPPAPIGTSGDFTIEGWMYFNSLGSAPQSLYSQKSGVNWFDVRWFQSAGNWQISFNGAGGTNMGGPGPTVNTWVHVAAVRSSGSVKLYINGTATGTTISNSSPLGYSDRTVYVGFGEAANEFLGGFIGSLRVSRSAVYTSNFTPDPGSLISIPGSTVFLTCQSINIQDMSGYNRPITSVAVTPKLRTIGVTNRYVYEFNFQAGVTFSYLTVPSSSDFLFSY